jgi:cysteine sulfinate desulfinase/cysteine desulfurase-like protein
MIYMDNAATTAVRKEVAEAMLPYLLGDYGNPSGVYRLSEKAKNVVEAETYEKEESIIKTNTVAIMFPFIRSQVTLLTTQPGMTPIVLPPINTTKFE